MSLSTNRPPEWSRKPAEPGFYFVFERGRGFDALFWPGYDDPAFDLPVGTTEGRALFFGPVKVPLSV